MLPINLMLDSSAAMDEKSILAGLLEFKKFFPERIITLDYSSADHLVRSARRIRRSNGRTQIDANDLLKMVQNYSDQKHHKTPVIEVLFTAKDLATEDTNFCFGAAWLGDRYTVQSTYRYQNLRQQDKDLVIKSVLQHELGHVLGMAADLSRNCTEYKLGPHCTDWNCVMHQSMNVNDAVRIARGARKHGKIYCSLCLADARRSKK